MEKRARRGAEHVGGRQRYALRGKGDGTGDEFARMPQRHVHRPVLATEFGEFPGAVEGVDDPHPLGGEPGAVGALLLSRPLGQHGIFGPVAVSASIRKA